MIDEKELKTALEDASKAMYYVGRAAFPAEASGTPDASSVAFHMGALAGALSRAASAIVLPLPFKAKKKEEEA